MDRTTHSKNLLNEIVRRKIQHGNRSKGSPRRTHRMRNNPAGFNRSVEARQNFSKVCAGKAQAFDSALNLVRARSGLL